MNGASAYLYISIQNAHGQDGEVSEDKQRDGHHRNFKKGSRDARIGYLYRCRSNSYDTKRR